MINSTLEVPIRTKDGVYTYVNEDDILEVCYLISRLSNEHLAYAKDLCSWISQERYVPRPHVYRIADQFGWISSEFGNLETRIRGVVGGVFELDQLPKGELSTDEYVLQFTLNNQCRQINLQSCSLLHPTLMKKKIYATYTLKASSEKIVQWEIRLKAALVEHAFKNLIDYV